MSNVENWCLKILYCELQTDLHQLSLVWRMADGREKVSRKKSISASTTICIDGFQYRIGECVFFRRSAFYFFSHMVRAFHSIAGFDVVMSMLEAISCVTWIGASIHLSQLTDVTAGSLYSKSTMRIQSRPVEWRSNWRFRPFRQSMRKWCFHIVRTKLIDGSSECWVNAVHDQ